MRTSRCGGFTFVDHCVPGAVAEPSEFECVVIDSAETANVNLADSAAPPTRTQTGKKAKAAVKRREFLKIALVESFGGILSRDLPNPFVACIHSWGFPGAPPQEGKEEGASWSLGSSVLTVWGLGFRVLGFRVWGCFFFVGSRVTNRLGMFRELLMKGYRRVTTQWRD